MPWPYDDEPFVPEVAQRMPEFVMPPISEPDYLGELTAPQEPEPDDFFARVAQGSGPAPFAPMQLDAKPTGLEMLLALAGGFVNAKTRRAGARISETQERNQRAREAAKTLATWRHQERLKKQEIAARREALDVNEQYRRDKMLQDAADRAARQGDLNEWRRVMAEIRRESIASANLRAGAGGAGGAAGTGAGAGAGMADDNDAVSIWARKLSTGEAKIHNVPQAVRTQAVDKAGTILPDKARNTIAELNAATSILSQLSTASAAIPRGTGMKRFAVGAKSKLAGFKQTEGLGEQVANYEAMVEGMLANLSRATGERGVLTNQDVDRVRKNIPTVLDVDTVSRRKIKNLELLFDQLRERTIRTYTQPMGGVGASPAPAATGGAMSDDAAYQEYLRMVGGKK